MSRWEKRVREKPYVVAIPVPSLNRQGHELGPAEIQHWGKVAEKELTACFGGATSLRAPGTNIVGSKVLYEAGQFLVVAGCDNREQFLAKRQRIAAFVEGMGEALDQAAVFVLAFDSDSFLIELEDDL